MFSAIDKEWISKYSDCFNCSLSTMVLCTGWKFGLFYWKYIKKNPEDLPVIDRNIYKSFLREKLFYDCADCVICLSEFTKNVIEKYYHVNEDKIVVLKIL